MLNVLPVIVTLGGAYLLFKLRFFFLRHPLKTVKYIINALKEKETRSSLALALAGTLGVGNIVGVAVGIITGGAGSVFWLLVSSIFAATLKYAESTLSQDGRAKGMMGVISVAFCKHGRIIASTYAALCILLSFFMGSALQTNSVISSFEFALSVPVWYGAIPFTILVGLVAWRGADSVKSIASFVIPIATAIYVFLCSAVIFSSFSRIYDVLNDIVCSVFYSESMIGGALGFLTGTALREGYSRGLLSNEAGAGTSSLAHTDVLYSHPTVGGLIGMCEVIFDTVILCMITALSILLSIPDASEYDTGISLVLDSIGAVYGDFSRVLLMACIFAFAFSTVICWYAYGTRCVSFLFGGGRKIYTVFFIASMILGVVVTDIALIAVTDYILLFLTVICVLSVIKRSDRLCDLSEQTGLLIVRRRL